MKHDRDASIERLLERAFPADGPAGPECLEVETLAAWAEGALSGRERAAAEHHAAACARCQALLAAMVQTAPLEDERSVPVSGLRAWSRWIVPLTAAATAVLVWINVQPTRDAVPEPASEAVDTLLPGAAAGRRARMEASSPALESEDSPGTRTQAAPAGNAQERPAEPPSGFAPVPLKESDLAAPAADARKVESARSAAVPTREFAGEAAAAARAPVQPLPIAPARPTEARQDEEARTPPVRQPPAAAAVAESVVSAERKADAAPPAILEIVARDSSVRWKREPDGTLRKSVDNGVSWSVQRTPVGAALVTSGSAPTGAVCWLAGRGGLVLRTTDGESWRRVPFPESIDLVAIDASDALNATVTAADGRRFVTRDAGASWATVSH